jgi:hypothetical protein
MKLPILIALVLFALPGRGADPSAPATAALPPIPKSQQSPVDIFRSLLVMPAAERREFLASKSPQQRAFLESKIQEYSAMSPNQREVRLKVTEIRWHLTPMMKLSPAERTVHLQSVPEEDRPFVLARLALWDLYPRPLQQQILDNDFTVRLAGAGTNLQRTLAQLPAGHREKAEVELARWASLTREERERRSEQFNHFFELSDQERQRTLRLISPPERQQMEKTLQAFEKLPREKRDRCLEAFHKFATLSPADREEFLRNASRWEAMTPDERQTWRMLVLRVPEFPPLPTSAEPPPRLLLTETNLKN